MAESMKDFERELEASFKRIDEGDIISGTVVSVDESGVVLEMCIRDRYYGAGRLQSHREPEKPSSQRLLYEPRAERYPGCLGYADGRLRKEDHQEAGSLCGGA